MQNLRDNAKSCEPPANQVLSTPFVKNLKQLLLFEKIKPLRTGRRSNVMTKRSLNLISAEVEVRSSEELICIDDFVLT